MKYWQEAKRQVKVYNLLVSVPRRRVCTVESIFCYSYLANLQILPTKENSVSSIPHSVNFTCKEDPVGSGQYSIDNYPIPMESGSPCMGESLHQVPDTLYRTWHQFCYLTAYYTLAMSTPMHRRFVCTPTAGTTTRIFLQNVCYFFSLKGL